MTEICDHEITDATAWRPGDLSESEWRLTMVAEEIDDLVAAAQQTIARGLQVTEIRAHEFPLRRATRLVGRLLEALVRDRGFVVVGGLPIHTSVDADTATRIFWGIGQHFGTAVSQNGRGELLGHVVDRGVRDPDRRTYESNVAHDFHSDGGDVVGLLCLRDARAGGDSLLASSTEVHNVVRAERPDMLPHLYKVYPSDRKGDEPAGASPHWPASVFSYVDGRLSVRMGTGFIRSAQRFADVPRLTDAEMEALLFVEEVPRRADMHIRMRLRPGDMQFLNNFVTLHSRTAYEDHDDPELRRHMLRLWIAVDNGRRLASDFQVRRLGIPHTPAAEDAAQRVLATVDA